MNPEPASSAFPLLFEGLSDRELISIYNNGKMLTIEADEVLFKEGDEDKTLYFIIEGSVRVTKNISGVEVEIAVIQKGYWIGEIAFIKQTRRTASIIAKEKTSLFSISEQGLSSLKSDTLITIFKQLNTIATFRMNDLIKRELVAQQRTRCLLSKLREALATDGQRYKTDELIMNIIEKIPKLPVYASGLIKKLNQDRASVYDIVELAKSDPSLAAIVLKTVNSAYYNLKFKISSIHHAILFLGFNQLYQLTLDTGIKKTMPDKPEFHEILSRANALSILGHEIAIASKRENAAFTGTVGLLSNIGRSVILLLKIQNPKLSLFLDYLDHYKLGSLLMEHWGLPDNICQCIDYLRYPDFAIPDEIPKEYRDTVAVLHIATIYYEYLSSGVYDESRYTFVDMYMNTLVIAENSPIEFIHKRVLPGLCGKMATFPESFRRLVESTGRCEETTPVSRPLF